MPRRREGLHSRDPVGLTFALHTWSKSLVGQPFASANSYYFRMLLVGGFLLLEISLSLLSTILSGELLFHICKVIDFEEIISGD
ncbi:hypothetical protein OPV22_027184 [Ensete ventricosum]|uniref:Uncharacterized protein n=1 Tax=Ensete ventricosum TaxID=4639 RepID=A0AAV8PUZ5_ENSVE|nr:hypothetical protein OPV22_027184 [Ensete ventricosum]